MSEEACLTSLDMSGLQMPISTNSHGYQALTGGLSALMKYHRSISNLLLLSEPFFKLLNPELLYL